MKHSCIITLILVWVSVEGLHIKYHESPLSYLASLKSQQTSVTSQLATIQSDISQTLQQISSEPDMSKKITIVEGALLGHKAKLSTLVKSLGVPLNESSWTCQTFAFTSQPELAALASNIASSTAQLDASVSSLENKTISQYFSPDSAAAASAAQEVQKSIWSSGSTQSTLTVKNETNWLASKWLVGSKSVQQIEFQTQSADQNTGYISPCPLATPFFNGNTCLACPEGSPYFNLETKTCVSCTIFDSATHTCKDQPNPINPSNPLPNITNFSVGLNRIIANSTTNLQTLQATTGQACPSERPFYTKNGCINCDTPLPLFDINSEACTTCPSGLTFVQDKHSCVGPKEVYATNLPIASNKLILPEGVSVLDLQREQQNLATTSTVINCPASTPFFNNSTCISCDNSYFEITSLTCKGCPTGQSYNETAHKCLAIIYYSNLNSRNWTSTNPDNIKKTTQATSGSPGALACPEQTPFYDGSKCVGCPSNEFFNFDGLKCEPCSPGSTFNLNLHSCVKPEIGVYQTNPSTAPNLIYDGTSKG